MKPLVSVILPVYNESIKWLAESLNSILSQTYRDLELIVILDNPHNNILKEYLQSQSDNRIKLICNKKNLGLPETLNVALKFVKGKYILRMDADDISELDRVEKQLSYLLTNKLDLVGSKYDTIDSNGMSINPKVNLMIHHKDIKKMLKYDQPMAHSSWLGKASIFNILKYRDIVGAEDYDFLCRAMLNGYKLGNHPDFLLHVRMRPSGITSKLRYVQLINKYVLVKTYRRALKYNRSYAFENRQVIDMSKFMKTYETYENGKMLFKTNHIKGVILLIKPLMFMPYSKYFRFKIDCRIFANILHKRQKSTL